MWIKVKCEKCGYTYEMMLPKNIDEKEKERAMVCKCGGKTKIIAEDD